MREPSMNDVFRMALNKTSAIETAIQEKLAPEEIKVRRFWAIMFMITPFVLYFEAKLAYMVLRKVFGE
jgi:hypothetical protein